MIIKIGLKYVDRTFKLTTSFEQLRERKKKSSTKESTYMRTLLPKYMIKDRSQFYNPTIILEVASNRVYYWIKSEHKYLQQFVIQVGNQL